MNAALAEAAEQERMVLLVVEPVGHEGLQFEPGQFAWLKLRHPLNLDEHPFSFSSSAENTQRLEFGIKQVGDFTQKLPEIPPGTAVYLDGPHGAFSVDQRRLMLPCRPPQFIYSKML